MKSIYYIYRYILRSIKFTKSHPASQPPSKQCSLGLSILRVSELEGSPAEAAASKFYMLDCHIANNKYAKWRITIVNMHILHMLNCEVEHKMHIYSICQIAAVHVKSITMNMPDCLNRTKKERKHNTRNDLRGQNITCGSLPQNNQKIVRSRWDDWCGGHGGAWFPLCPPDPSPPPIYIYIYERAIWILAQEVVICQKHGVRFHVQFIPL